MKYALLKRSKFNGYADDYWLEVLESDRLDKISSEIKKRVTDGCPLKNLRVVKNTSFNVDWNVEFKKENEDGMD